MEKINYHWDSENPQTYKSKMGQYKTQEESEFINKYINKKSYILDIGGGSGRHALPLIKKGNEVVVIDTNENAIKLAQERGIKDSYCINIFDYESNKKFDAIISIEAFDYFDNISMLLLKINKLINKEGILLFNISNKNSWRTKLRKLKKHDKGFNSFNNKSTQRP